VSPAPPATDLSPRRASYSLPLINPYLAKHAERLESGEGGGCSQLFAVAFGVHVKAVARTRHAPDLAFTARIRIVGVPERLDDPDRISPPTTRIEEVASSDVPVSVRVLAEFCTTHVNGANRSVLELTNLVQLLLA
jgi:hypothetical protein